MLAHLHDYFAGEKQAGWWAAAIGLLAIAASIWLWRTRPDLRGMVWPILLVGIAQLGVGVGLAARTDGQVAALVQQFQADPVAYQVAETARMTRVQRTFAVIEIAEIVLLAAGVALAMALRAGAGPWWAAGMGIVLQASVMLVFDLLAERRGAAYLAHVVGLT